MEAHAVLWLFTSLITGAFPTAVASSNDPTMIVEVTANPESNYWE